MDLLKQFRKNVEDFRRNITEGTVTESESKPRTDHIGHGCEQTYRNFDEFLDEYEDCNLSRDELRKIYDENVFADFSELIAEYSDQKELDWLYTFKENQEIYNSWEEFYEK